ncbi:MAG: choice-of-anchor D domain-containing protein [FCB group bacterium]|nr:choice-of-anchor D domain-containing protein [FCB group bacterium]MBL7027471.1 choice-of-anchor D domain-containing protein [Candidatus Neomarinimicrobiota bacterium]MBL7122084.1 choice-of-anchor D domain-containing protein [Candidatus Neomarinimicrobiota bacterium]
MWRKLLLTGLILSVAFTSAFAVDVRAVGEDHTAAVIEKNRLDMSDANNLLARDASSRNDFGVLDLRYDYIYAVTDFTIPSGVPDITETVTVTDVATVGTVTIDYDWDTDSYPGEGAFKLTSPAGTQLTIGAGQTDGHYTVALSGFTGEDLAGDWVFLISDSYSDGGHALTNATMNVDVAAITPEISLSPVSIDFGGVPLGMVLEETVTISNVGGGALTVSSISADDANFYSVDASASVPAFGSVDITVGFDPSAVGDYTASLIFASDDAGSPDTIALSGSALPSIGGPDAAGYTWVNSFDVAGPTYAWIDTVGSTDAIIANGDDYRGTIDIPFTFRFYGNLYTQLTATTNGWIGMGPSSGYTSSFWTNEPILDTSTPNNIIAPLWDDFKAGDAPGSSSSAHGTIKYKTLGTEPNRQFVVIFDEIVRGTYDTDYFSFEVILDEATSDITVQYLDVLGNTSADNGIGATVGIENIDGSDGLEYLYNGSPQLVYDEMAIQFVAPPPPSLPNMVLDVTALNFGSVPVGGSASADVMITNNGSGDLVVSGATVAAPFSTTYSGTIAENTSATATIFFDPTATGPFAETLTFTVTGDYTADDDAVALSGSAYPADFVLEDFEGGAFPPYGWTIIDVDGGSAINPDLSYIDPYSGEVAAEGMGCADDYLITPSLTIPAGYADFSFWHGQESVNYENSFKLMVSTTGTDPADFVEVVDYPNVTPPEADAWTMETVDLSAYAGQDIYVALYVYYSESSYYGFGFDDILMPPLTPNTNTPFFSEYMEGSSNNKGIEIYNLTGSTLNLDEYQIAQSNNGGGWQYYHAFPAGATLDHQDLWVIVTDQSFPEMQAIADEVLGYPSVVHHNGNDARALIHIVGTDTTFLDIIGLPDDDGYWSVAGVAEGTREHNLVRKPDVETGNTDWALSAGTDVDDSEWIVYDQNFWYGLGYHNEDYPLPGDNCDLALVYGDVNDPAMEGAIDSYGAAWYTFYNDGTYDNVFASLCGSGFDTKIEVWAGCDSATYIAYNDDFCGTQSEVDLGELPAGDYWVKVYGYSSSSGEYTLNVTGTNGVPDFVVSSMEYYGQDTLDVVVTNIGDGDSPGYAGTDWHGLYVDGDYLGYVAEDGIALLAGASHTYTLIGINYDFLGVGIHEVVFEADTDDDVLEIDETNNTDTLMIEIGYPPLAPRHVMAMAGEAHVSLYWETAVIPVPDLAGLGRSIHGVSETRSKPAVVFSQELLDKRDRARGSAFREAGDTCAEAVELTVADGSVVSAPYAPYWYSYTPAADGYLTASSDGLTTEDTKVYAYDDCDLPYIDYDDDGGAGLQSILTIPVTAGTTYYFEWSDQYSSAAFDWSLTYIDYLPLADLEVTEMYLEGDAVFAVITNIGVLDAAGVSCHWWVNGEDVAYEYTDLLVPTAADTLGLYGFTWANLGAGTFTVAMDVDFWGSVDEMSEANNLDSITVVLEDPDYMPTYNLYRDDVLLVGDLDAINRDFDGEYIDEAVVADVEYTYYVTQILEDLSETIPSESVSATPWAPVFYPFPFTEDFEAVTDHLTPFGYVTEEIGEPDGGNWEVGDSAYFQTNAYNGWHPAGSTGQFAGIDDDGVAITSNGNEILWTPWVDFATAVNPQILFNYTVRGGLGGEFIVFDGEDAMVYPLEDAPMEWSGALFNLGEYAGDVVRFGFHYDDNGGWAYGMGVDNIVVEEAPLPGTITGTVLDVDGNAIDHANVHAMGLFADEGTMTDAAGVYTLTVPAGDYDVEVMRVNYHPVMAEMVTVAEGAATTLDFVLEMYLPAPTNLMAYPSMVDTTIGLMWAPPVPMGQVAYDDGTYEGFVTPVSPSTADNFFAAHFKAAISPGYAINEVSVLSTATGAESAFESVSVLGSDEMGLPDFSNVLWTAAGVDAALYPDAAWDFYPVGVTPTEHDFWVVIEWPVGNEFGPYVGHDDDTFIGNSIWSNAADTSGAPAWIMDPGTFAIHAYLGEPSTGRSVVLHGSETVNIEKLGAPIELSVKQDLVSTGSVEGPTITTVGRELLNYNVFRSMDPMVFGDAYANVAGEMFFDDDFTFDTQYFYTVSAVYDLGESGYSNVDAFTYWSPLYLHHYEDFTYPDATPLEDIGFVTDDGAGNVAPNWGIEDEMLHFDWSPTATDFYQTVTSPMANFAGATAARFSFYLMLDDYNDADNGTLDIMASISNDGFVTETVLFAHNDSIFGNIDDYMIFNVSDVVAGTDGWQLRFTVEGATSFTMDHLWIDDIMVESDVYPGPGDFSLLSPANDDNVVITSANVATGSLLFAWESAGDDMMYGVELTGTLGSVIIPFDTSATEVLIPYSVLSAAFEFTGTTGVTGTWDIVAYSDMYDAWSLNGPFNLTIGTTVGTDDTFIPDVFALYQNYPNPFNPVTTITYDIPEASDVRLVVYNLVGQPVSVLVNGFQNPSRYTLAWNGLSDAGLPVSSGIYVYRLETDSYVKTMKMMYLK